jgi:hypothetical protein
MNKFKVGCSPLTSRIFAGTVSDKGLWGKVKHDVTDTAVSAVAQHLLQLDSFMEFNYEGAKYKLSVTKIK